jgi:hypothetical protein
MPEGARAIKVSDDHLSSFKVGTLDGDASLFIKLVNILIEFWIS